MTMINHKNRYFVLKPEAEKKYRLHRERLTEVLEKRIEIATDFLTEQGVPKEKINAAMRENGQMLVSPEVKKYAPSILSKFGKKWLKIRTDRKATAPLFDKLSKHPVEQVQDVLPTLDVGRYFFMGSYMSVATIGTYGDKVVLIGVPKDEYIVEDTFQSAPYEPDLSMLEELTLSQWADLVTAFEESKKKEGE